jgi:ABC-type uncharacterized transport system substrate-binding protein
LPRTLVGTPPSTFAKEVVGLQPDVILSVSTPVTAALQRETRTIPIVFLLVTDPVGDGFVASVPRPGGNITGFMPHERSIGSKWLELLAGIAPGVKRVAAMFNPDTAPCAEAGRLISYSASLLEQHTQIGIYVGRILKGEKPADQPVQQAIRLELVINVQTAKILGLTIPETLLATADEVIQ